MKTRTKVLIGTAFALLVLLIVAYFGRGHVIYSKWLPRVKPPRAVASVAVIDTQSATPMPRPVEQTRSPSITASEMQWETIGGGQVTFGVKRDGQSYDVHVTSLRFKNRDDRFRITAESGPVYRAIAAVMQDQRTIGLHALNEPPRGSWTTLRFSDGERASTFKDVIVEGDLKIIYDYMVKQIEHE